ncbi:glycosyltransferase family 4 protein [Tundrisphaera lichenicola]|uniref:glycosyltransferase family 4 protein n=1 Tax=Tundrisphaera lichenicola TaxID=2029860 RepID=UPI003EBAE916
MRLVIDGRRLTAERTGVGRYLEVLLQDWAITGPPLPETLVVVRDRAGLSRVPSGSGIRAEVVGERWPGLVWEQLALRRRLGPDDLLFAPANLIPRGWRGPTVLVMHDVLQEAMPDQFPWHVRWRFGRRYRRAARMADRVLTPSESTRRDVARYHGVPEGRIRVIYPAADPSFRPQGPESEEVTEARARVGVGPAPFFLYVGKTSARRNVPAILEAFSDHHRRHPDHRLVFVGPDSHRTGREGDDGSVLRAGHVAEPVLRGLLADALALLYPTEYEGFGLPIVEAMASGCPVVTLRRGAMQEAAGDAAWYLDNASADELAHAMYILANDQGTRASRMARGFQQADRFQPARFADEVKAEIRDVAGFRPALKGPSSRLRAGLPSSLKRGVRTPN